MFSHDDLQYPTAQPSAPLGPGLGLPTNHEEQEY